FSGELEDLLHRRVHHHHRKVVRTVLRNDEIGRASQEHSLLNGLLVVYGVRYLLHVHVCHYIQESSNLVAQLSREPWFDERLAYLVLVFGHEGSEQGMHRHVTNATNEPTHLLEVLPPVVHISD